MNNHSPTKINPMSLDSPSISSNATESVKNWRDSKKSGSTRKMFRERERRPGLRGSSSSPSFRITGRSWKFLCLRTKSIRIMLKWWWRLLRSVSLFLPITKWRYMTTRTKQLLPGKSNSSSSKLLIIWSNLTFLLLSQLSKTNQKDVNIST